MGQRAQQEMPCPCMQRMSVTAAMTRLQMLQNLVWLAPISRVLKLTGQLHQSGVCPWVQTAFQVLVMMSCERKQGLCRQQWQTLQLPAPPRSGTLPIVRTRQLKQQPGQV